MTSSCEGPPLAASAPGLSTPATPTVPAQSSGPVAVDGSAPDLAIQIRGLNAWYGERRAIRDITLDVRVNAITAIIGPSGSGKSTLIRCLDRMHEVVPGARSSGQVTYQGVDIYDPDVEPAAVRRTIGMVFQQAQSLPDDEYLRQRGRTGQVNRLVKGQEGSGRPGRAMPAPGGPVGRGQGPLRKAGSLSGGQQQRCIARTMAVGLKSC